MCGILFYSSLETPYNQEAFFQSLSEIQHRGSDGSGYWFSDQSFTAIGHNRLAINGGADANQPMLSADGRLVIAVNGELYNSRLGLESLGACFKTQSDSEFLLHQFQHKGCAGFDELDGEFAFAIWDESNKTAYLGRDRHGIKPLFYCKYQGGIIAASEVKALLAYGVPAKWNKRYLAGSEYFIQNARETFVEGVYAVPPGSFLKITSMGVDTVSYVQQSPFDPSAFTPSTLSFDHACEQFESLLLQAIEKRLISGGSNQAYLSSGIDSSIITAITAGLSDSVNAYSIGFDDNSFDESKQAQAFAAELGVAHEIVQVSDHILADHFQSAVLHCEMPVPNINVAAKYYLSSVLSDAGHKTVLTGEGADESLLGYGFFRQDLTEPYSDIGLFPEPWKKHLQNVKQSLGFLPAQAVHSTPIGLMLSQLRQAEYALEPSLSTFEMQAPSSIDGIEGSQKLHYQSVFQSYNLGALADRTEMAHGIEGRPPFLDNALVAFVHSLPTEYKFDGAIDKKILRHMAGKYMPSSYAKIEKKPFISAPSSLRKTGPLADLFQDLFMGLEHLPYFYNKEKVRGLYLDALNLDPSKQASLDPIFMHLASLMVLQKEFGLTE